MQVTGSPVVWRASMRKRSSLRPGPLVRNHGAGEVRLSRARTGSGPQRDLLQAAGLDAAVEGAAARRPRRRTGACRRSRRARGRARADHRQRGQDGRAMGLQQAGGERHEGEATGGQGGAGQQVGDRAGPGHAFQVGKVGLAVLAARGGGGAHRDQAAEIGGGADAVEVVFAAEAGACAGGRAPGGRGTGRGPCPGDPERQGARAPGRGKGCRPGTTPAGCPPTIAGSLPRTRRRPAHRPRNGGLTRGGGGLNGKLSQSGGGRNCYFLFFFASRTP